VTGLHFVGSRAGPSTDLTAEPPNGCRHPLEENLSWVHGGNPQAILLERGRASSGDQASRLAELERLRGEVSELTRIRDKARLRLARLCDRTPALGLSHATPQIPPIPTRMPAKGKDADANVLIADKALPAGAHVAIILTIKTSPEAKAVIERFEMHLH